MTRPMRNAVVIAAAVGAALLLTQAACGQSLLVRPTSTPGPPPAQPGAPAQPVPGAAPESGRGGTGDPAHVLRGRSLFAIAAPQPRGFKQHDVVQILINESSDLKFQQNVDDKKQYDLAASLTKFPSLRNLLEAQLRNEGTTPAEVAVKHKGEFKGDGKNERKDTVTARIAAMVLEVKPNGTLVLEARESIQSDGEVSTMVLSGICRPEDVTTNNTVQSSQLADLTISSKHEGDVRDATKKGWIPRILDTIFNF